MRLASPQLKIAAFCRVKLFVPHIKNDPPEVTRASYIEHSFNYIIKGN